MVSAERVNCIECDKVFYTDYDPTALDRPYHERLGSMTCPECRKPQGKIKNDEGTPHNPNIPRR